MTNLNKVFTIQEASARFVPVLEFLDSLDLKMRQKMLRAIQALQDIGMPFELRYQSHWTMAYFEHRDKAETNISHMIYFFFIGDRAVLTHGFIKKTEKTPLREKERAKKIRDDYIERFGQR